MMFRSFTLGALLLLAAACRNADEKVHDGAAGLPGTETTGTAQSPSTSTADVTTTGASGGTLSAAAPADKQFAADAGMAGLAEVQMGNLALQKARSADVKAFAQRMVSDHSKANEELQQLVTAKGLALPAELAGDHKAGLEHLTSMSGAEFDKTYMQHMVSDHQKAVTLFQNGANTLQDADIKGYATKNLPILQEHLRLAQQVSGKLR